jgi:hypothetical protein
MLRILVDQQVQVQVLEQVVLLPYLARQVLALFQGRQQVQVLPDASVLLRES